jgi:Ni/Co efflux regulator RcnB
MRQLALVAAIAVAAQMVLAPTARFSVANAEPGAKLAQDRDRDRDDRRDREFREHSRRDCRDVTMRERRGDDVIVRHERRCD